MLTEYSNVYVFAIIKNVNSLKLINLKLVLCYFLPYLCNIIKGVIKIPYSLTTKKIKT